MRQWITDRRPRLQDSVDGLVLAWHDGKSKMVPWDFADYSDLSWIPIERPEPYVKPPRFTVVWYDNVQMWGVKDSQDDEHGLQSNFETKQAAERIAAIYNEVLS